MRMGFIRTRPQRDFEGAIGRELCARSHFIRQMLRPTVNLTKLRRTLCLCAGDLNIQQGDSIVQDFCYWDISWAPGCRCVDLFCSSG